MRHDWRLVYRMHVHSKRGRRLAWPVHSEASARNLEAAAAEVPEISEATVERRVGGRWITPQREGRE